MIAKTFSVSQFGFRIDPCACRRQQVESSDIASGVLLIFAKLLTFALAATFTRVRYPRPRQVINGGENETRCCFPARSSSSAQRAEIGSGDIALDEAALSGIDPGIAGDFSRLRPRPSRERRASQQK